MGVIWELEFGGGNVLMFPVSGFYLRAVSFPTPACKCSCKRLTKWNTGGGRGLGGLGLGWANEG